MAISKSTEQLLEARIRHVIENDQEIQEQLLKKIGNYLRKKTTAKVSDKAALKAQEVDKEIADTGAVDEALKMAMQFVKGIDLKITDKSSKEYAPKIVAAIRDKKVRYTVSGDDYKAELQKAARSGINRLFNDAHGKFVESFQDGITSFQEIDSKMGKELDRLAKAAKLFNALSPVKMKVNYVWGAAFFWTVYRTAEENAGIGVTFPEYVAQKNSQPETDTSTPDDSDPTKAKSSSSDRFESARNSGKALNEQTGEGIELKDYTKEVMDVIANDFPNAFDGIDYEGIIAQIKENIFAKK